MVGRDPRSDDDTEELPPVADAFTTDPERRAETSYIAARAATLIGLFRSPGSEFWAHEEEGGPEHEIAPIDQPAWDANEFLRGLAEFDGLAPEPSVEEAPELREWAASLPDDAPAVEDTPYRSVAEPQAAAVAQLLSTDQANPAAVLSLVTSSLLDEHPLVRVAAAAATERQEQEPGSGRRARNPVARAILDDALRTRSDEVAALAAACTLRRKTLAETLVSAVQGTGPDAAGTDEADAPAIPDAALIHGTWARRQGWWHPDGKFHEFLKDESRVFPALYSGAEPWEWSGYYGFRNRLPRKPIDWNRSQAGGALAWWAHRKLRCPPHLIGHSCGASVAMLATRVQRDVRALVLLSPSVHKSCLPDPAYYRGALVVRARRDLVLRADGSNYMLLRKLPRVTFVTVPRKGQTGHTSTHEPACWRAVGLDHWVRDQWLPRV